MTLDESKSFLYTSKHWKTLLTDERNEKEYTKGPDSYHFTSDRYLTSVLILSK